MHFKLMFCFFSNNLSRNNCIRLITYLQLQETKKNYMNSQTILADVKLIQKSRLEMADTVVKKDASLLTNTDQT